MNQSYPLISCICITNNSPGQLKKAISCFADQNYPNKELAISYLKNDVRSKEIIENIRQKDILKIVPVEHTGDEPLEKAKIHVITKCTGDYVCIWDEDDWYHPSRLMFQFNSMQIIGERYQASVLSRIMLYDTGTKKVYHSFPRNWDGTLLCRKEIFLLTPYTKDGENTSITAFLSGRKILCQIDDAPFLYIHIYHGANIHDDKHFESFMKQSELLAEEPSNKVIKLIDN